MSKLDAVRAMREARYAETQSRTATPAKAAPKKAAPAKAAPKKAAARTPVDAAEDTAADGLCGHRNISGRTCTRERGHAAKSHRYS